MSAAVYAGGARNDETSLSRSCPWRSRPRPDHTRVRLRWLISSSRVLSSGDEGMPSARRSRMRLLGQRRPRCGPPSSRRFRPRQQRLSSRSPPQSRRPSPPPSTFPRPFEKRLSRQRARRRRWRAHWSDDEAYHRWCYQSRLRWRSGITHPVGLRGDSSVARQLAERNTRIRTRYLRPRHRHAQVLVATEAISRAWPRSAHRLSTAKSRPWRKHRRVAHSRSLGTRLAT